MNATHPASVIEVDAFTRPGDPDSAPGIRAAVARALATGAGVLRFAAGRYLLRSADEHDAPGIIHDVDSLDQAPRKACHIHLRGAQGLVIEGARDAQGDPATVLAGHNDRANHGLLPAILWCEDSPGLTVRDLAFTRDPVYASAGLVIERSSATVVVEVLDGEPCWDGMGAYCMNRCDPATGALRGASVTFGRGAGTLWRRREGRVLALDSAEVAAQVAPGELLSWHQGARTDIQTYFGACHGLQLENLRTANANGLAMVAERCRDIRADRIVLRPDGRRLFTAPRDGWKLYRCSGRIEVTRLHVHGVRMDGQNLHSTWLQREGDAGGDAAVFGARYACAPLEAGSEVECWLGDRLTVATIADWRHAGRSVDGHRYQVRFTAQLPAGPGLLAAPLCWQPERYTCRDSTFSSIAGAGHLIRGGRVEITGCTYRDLMCPGIHLGAEVGTHPEGGHVTDVLVEDCSFTACGGRERARYDRGPGGCIATGTIGDIAPADGDFNRRIRIRGNRFADVPLGISLRQAAEIEMKGNRFSGVACELAR
jgi:hypothetical protein